jgi:CxxC motif-containing protein
MAECMALINQAVATLPVTIGDVILADVFGSNVVATQNRNFDE